MNEADMDDTDRAAQDLSIEHRQQQVAAILGVERTEDIDGHVRQLWLDGFRDPRVMASCVLDRLVPRDR